MRTAVITEKHKVEVIEAPTPELKDNEVLIRVKAAGICGSDVHLFHDLHPFRKPPMIPGHEVSGEVVAVGKAVSESRIGERVVVNHAIPCGECYYCKQGLPNICPTKIVAGSAKMMGFFAEYINVPESTLFKIEDHVSYEVAALAEPLSIGFHIMRRLEPSGKGPLAILGTGTIGLVALIAAKSLGYDEIYCIDPVEHNLAVAKQLGATECFNPFVVQASKEIKKRTDGLGAHLTVLTAGSRGILTDAFAVTRQRGTIIMLPMTSEVMEGNFYGLVSGEQTLIGCRGIVPEDFENAVKLINSGYDLSLLVTHVLPLAETQRGFELMVNRTEPVIKVLVNPER